MLGRFEAPAVGKSTHLDCPLVAQSIFDSKTVKEKHANNRRIFFCQLCHLPHQVGGGVVVCAGAKELQHLLDNDCNILGVCDPKEQLQRLQAGNKQKDKNGRNPREPGGNQLH